jgi:glycosyltransferase involved in cell wall biosynthesis
MTIGRGLRVGVINLASTSWSAGASYSRMLALSLARVAREAELEVSILGQPGQAVPAGTALLPLVAPDVSLRGKLVRHSLQLRERLPASRAERRVRQALGWVDASDPLHAARQAGLDVVLPFIGETVPHDVRTVGWIPDLQHRGLPAFFSAEERAARDRVYGATARNTDQLIVSSQAVFRHCQQELSAFRAVTTHVARFPSLFAFGELPAPVDVVKHYRLPAKFMLVANQFWAHKNHAVVLRALGRLAELPEPPHLVMVGRPADYRDPSNQLVSSLLQEIASRGIRAHTSLLGEVPYAHLVSLLRNATLVLQPSRFEGWSTTVQDARALGRPVACSDIDTHREQAPDAAFFFDQDDDAALAEQLARHWPRLAAGPDASAAERAQRCESVFAHEFARLVAGVCYRAAGRVPPPGLR